jgi:hypothetical protein
MKVGQRDASDVRRAEAQAKLFDHTTKRDRLRLHQIPHHGISHFVIDIAAGEPGDCRGDILGRHRLKRSRSFRRREINRKRRQRAQQRTASIGRRRDHKARSQDRVRDAEYGNQSFGFALGPAEGGAILRRGAGDRDVNKANRAAAATDRLQQPLDEIAMHGADIAAWTVLQHAQAIDHDINAVIPDQPRQRGRIHRHHRHLQIERVCLLRRRESPCDPGDMKAPCAQIVGNESPNQAGRAEHEDFAQRSFSRHGPPRFMAWRSSARE